MALKIGGIVYPFAPFNGFYMGTEIGARNLADRDRYNVLPDVARIFQLETSNNRTLWRDRALVELNRAVLHSFDKAGITIGDHHKLGEQFEAFCKAEEKTGKEVSGDWSWLNPPMSPSQTPQFHREFKNKVERHTNFFYQPEPEALVKPPSGCPFHL
jgi:nitric-oxide synthase